MRILSEDLIHFVGNWTAAERLRLRRSVTTFEQAWDASARASTVDHPEWIVVQESPAWGSYYFAHRLDTHDSLTAQSATGLAEVIEHSSRHL